jgi:hypothetical protein
MGGSLNQSTALLALHRLLLQTSHSVELDLCKITVSQYAILPTVSTGLLVSMFSRNNDDDRTLAARLLPFWNRSFPGDLRELVA